MGKKSTPIEKAARMLDLVPFISTHQGISVSDLASEFGISQEELLSDLNSLWMCGDNRFDLIDLEFDSGYVTIRNAETLNLTRSLTSQENISILIGLDLIDKGLPPEREDLKTEISLLRTKLGAEISKMLDASPAQDGSIVATLNSALTAQRRILISYLSSTHDELSEREVTPLAITSRGPHDFMMAFCESAQGERTFRVDRIKSAVLLDKSAQISTPTKSAQEMITVQVKISRNLRKSRESLGEFITGEGSNVAVSTYNPAWLSRTVIASAGSIVVTSPDEIRAVVAKNAEKALEQYR